MLTAIVGNLGAGKTATLCYLAKHFFVKGDSIFANFLIKDINHKYVLSVADIDQVKFGKAFYDEFWLWLDSRTSSFDEYNKKISDILLKSRKRGYDIYYTLQGFYQIDKRVRNITDYVLVPESFLFVNGELQKVEQNFLNPINMKPYLQNIVISVDICRPIGESELEKIDTFSYWLRDVADSYSTEQEVESIKNPLQKGIYIEGTFVAVLESVLNKELYEVTQSPNSGHYQDTLDIEIVNKHSKNLYLIDVCSLSTRKTENYQYFYLDFRKKSVEKIIKIGESRKASGVFVAYKKGNEWKVVCMNDEKVQKKFKSKEHVNVKDLKRNEINLSEMKELMI